MKPFNRVIPFLGLLFLFFSKSNGQSFDRLAIDFYLGEEKLPNALAGGLNTAQLSLVDLNNDGNEDLYVFDRVGDKQLTFLHDGMPGSAQYTFAPEYAENFPDMINWVLLRDFNGDGIADIFAYSDIPGVAGVMAYRGFYQEDKIAFERVKTDYPYGDIFFYFPPGSTLPAQLYITNVDYPAVDDLDCDGDLDILTFDLAGGYAELFSNQSVEMGYGLDSLIFDRTENCWGGFHENGLSEVITLSETRGVCATDFNGEEIIDFRHSGSTLLTFDIDNDGDKELVVGDISFPLLNLLTNGGDCQDAWITQQDVVFPQVENPVAIPIFPAAFYLDINHDGKDDLVAAPNDTQNAEDYDALWYYENTGSQEFPEFELRMKNFLIESMLDFGSGATPVFVDYNADSLLDIVVGNAFYYKDSGETDARLFLFENTGTQYDPVFELIDDDFLEMNQLSQDHYYFAPAFADFDDDGDLDVVVGEQYGTLFYNENMAGPGAPMQFGEWQAEWQGISIGQSAVPCPVDLDGDGLIDLLVGERNGNINYFKNQGTKNQPFYSPDPNQAPNTFFLGKVDTRIPGYFTGNSSPVVLEQDGALKLYTGSKDGRIEVYSAVEENIYGEFDLETETFGNVHEGTNTHPAFADINRDGFLELLVGNYSGGLSFFTTDIQVDTTVSYSPGLLNQNMLQLFPNPASDFVKIICSDDARLSTIDLYDLSGKRIKKQLVADEKEILLNVKGLSSGLYVLKGTGKHGVVFKKLILSN